MADEGFHEIQLSGKQLVFLFMTTTVVLVVIFLCGVLVGRGVRAERPGDVAGIMAAEPIADAAPPPTPPAEPPPPTSEGTPAATQPTPDELSYYKRLEAEGAPAENLKPAAPPAAVLPPPEAPPLKPAESGAAESTSSSSTTAAPVGPADGWAIQVAALRERREAEAIVRRLAAKGYPAYVVDPAPGAPAVVFRVRVGKYKDRREAEQFVRRLEREEQFKPWITR